MKCQIGDWIRFQRDGGLVVGTVAYIICEDFVLHDRTLITEVGSVDEKDVLERRSKSKIAKAEP